MMSTGIQLTIYGMGLVFLLLMALWGMMSLLLRLDRPSAAAKQVVDTPPPAMQITPATDDREKLAAIALAVVTHQIIKRNQAAPHMRTHWPGTLPSRWVGAGRTRQNRSWYRDR